jgi:hypothetical protein
VNLIAPFTVSPDTIGRSFSRLNELCQELGVEGPEENNAS